MAKLKVYEIPTTSGKEYNVGLFEGDQMLKSLLSKPLKTRKGAEMRLSKLMKNR